MNPSQQTRELILKGFYSKPQQRMFNYDIKKPASRGLIDEPNRIVEFSLSSETDTVEREFGIEILSHKPEHIRMGRITNGAPWLADHNPKDQLGIIERASVIDSKLIVETRFSRNPRPNEVFIDVVDKIKIKTSVGYTVYDMEQVGVNNNGKRIFLVTDWEPYEGSSLSIGADDSVGAGRSFDAVLEQVKVEPEVIKEPTPQSVEPKKETIIEVRKMDPVIDVNKIANDAVALRNKEVAEMQSIPALFPNFKNADAITREFISQGKSYLDLTRKINEEFKSNPQNFSGADKPLSQLDLTEKEKKNYRILNLVNAAHEARNNPGGAAKISSLENDMSQEIAKRMGHAPKNGGNFIPYDIQKKEHRDNQGRAMSVGTTTAGGYLVQTDLRADMFVDVLLNNMVSGRLNTTKINGVVGNIAIPRMTTNTTGSWVAENGSATESSPVFDQISMSAKTMTANTIYSRELRLQSTPDAEAIAMYAGARCLALKRDYAFFNGLGTSNEPTGIFNTSGINSISPSSNGDAPTWALACQMEKEIAIDNGIQGALAMVMNGATQYAFKTTPKVTAQPIYLIENNLVNGYPFFVSEQIPSNVTKGSSGATLSKAVLGYWPDFVVADWGTLEIVVDIYTYSNDGRTRVNFFQDVDYACKHPTSFVSFADIITA